ncbi:cytochrome C assembly family protein [Algibacillus agarilyticus]|uniref:cytochrome C assembly family protein n=1 Tax=Algibacillus agarilyticus TaxID=2234133 RepID=UPI001300AF83|nr:cytochrome c biogenesis protein CcsA [Algibacillus agarilyticus]
MLLAVLGIIGYLFSAIALLLIFFNHAKLSLKFVVLPGIVAFICHVLFVQLHYQLNEPSAYNLVLVANIISLVVGFTALGFAQKYHNYFVVPVCFLFSSLMLFIGIFAPISLTTVASWSIETLSHISFALLAYAVLTITTLLSFQYSFISNRLKSHDLSVLQLPLPALNDVEKQIFKLLLSGTLFLTVSIITGAVFLDNFFGSGQSHKAILSILAWCCFTSLLIGHSLLGWRGNITLALTLSGSTLLTLGYFGSRIIHDFVMMH